MRCACGYHRARSISSVALLRPGRACRKILAELERRSAPDVVVFSDFASPAVVAKCRGQGAMAALTKADYLQLRSFLERYRGQLVQSA